MAMKACVFFDRDGVVNREPDAYYLRSWDSFEWIPEFRDVLRQAKAHGFEAAIITNQKGIATGDTTPEAVDEIHRNIKDSLAREYGLDILGVYCCPHAGEECECRKPKPGMLLQAAGEHELDLARSWMIGDQERDIEAGRRAGCRTIRVNRTGESSDADFVVRDMMELRERFASILEAAADADSGTPHDDGREKGV